MSRQFNFRTDNGTGTTILPISDTSFFTPELTTGATDAEVYFEFFSDAAGTTPVTPTAGTITVSGSPLGNNYLAASSNNVIQATQVEAGDSSYTPPVLDGLTVRARIVLDGITGATYMKAVLFKYGS